MKNKIDRLWDDISFFTDDRKLTEEQKDFCINHILRANKILKNLLLKGYILEIGIAYFRKILKLKQSEKWKKLREMSIKEIIFKMGFKVDVYTFKIFDEKRSMILETYNTNNQKIMDCINSYHDTVLANQYNVSSARIKNKIVIDGGSNLGEFAIYCARLGAKKVYAFEPVTSTYEIMKKQIEINRLQNKVIPVKMAVGGKNETVAIGFSYIGDIAANIGLDVNQKNFEVIEVVKLDDFIKNGEKIGFLKLDVEGYEENALRGALKIIKKDKPILSFSAYHKPADKKRLPLVVREIRPDYKILLLKRAEEDFYCE